MSSSPCTDQNAMPTVPRFTPDTLAEARGLTRTATETVVASVLDVPVARLRTWRSQGIGPVFDTLVNGQIVYEKNAVLAFIHRNMNRKAAA
ncbi:hypothetical protein [Bifidobacterium saguinibicoloris]|uniref:hypothetical protein n=1 Tax=Bifidobacterium saguinibicoloris TaxID=2834433 RepID=UPI001C565CFA|nr:hypothetical protein [Bifidobacterium saguinibicoloris]MBW3080903.1 hypothetical protein [Bifidobacterium saguinibicoloris]